MPAEAENELVMNAEVGGSQCCLPLTRALDDAGLSPGRRAQLLRRRGPARRPLHRHMRVLASCLPRLPLQDEGLEDADDDDMISEGGEEEEEGQEVGSLALPPCRVVRLSHAHTPCHQQLGTQALAARAPPPRPCCTQLNPTFPTQPNPRPLQELGVMEQGMQGVHDQVEAAIAGGADQMQGWAACPGARPLPSPPAIMRAACCRGAALADCC